MSYETDLAWAAGFFDGDGCIVLARIPRPKRYRTPRHDAYLSARQSTREPLSKMQTLLGGSIGITRQYAKTTWPKAPGENTPSHRIANRKNGTPIESYYWHLGGHKKIYDTLQRLLPYLVVKKAQAEALLPFLRLFFGGPKRVRLVTDFEIGTRDWYWRRLKDLKRTDLRIANQGGV